ncbi:MAG: hypothetical protein JWO32_1569 [Bacteroidetes bacterium]|nr:hypothetical protein [Bacteroidota bacterium]
MNKKIIVFVTTFVMLIFLLSVSCEKKSAKSSGIASVLSASECSEITYTKNIEPIIRTSCAIKDCHAAGSPNNNLTGYPAVKAIGDNGSMKAYVLDGNPYFMPKGGQLSPEEKELVQCWLNNGKKE